MADAPAPSESIRGQDIQLFPFKAWLPASVHPTLGLRCGYSSRLGFLCGEAWAFGHGSHKRDQRVPDGLPDGALGLTIEGHAVDHRLHNSVPHEAADRVRD